MGWGKFFMYAGSGVGGLTFAYFFYKANFSIHQTELLILRALRRLPLYPPPGPSVAERNTSLDPEGLPPDLVQAFLEWFVVTDAKLELGVTRDDLLELLEELGITEEEKTCRDFLLRGEGHLEERKRFTGCGLQESLSLLGQLYRLPCDSEGVPRLGPEATELLRRKVQGASGSASPFHFFPPPAASAAAQDANVLGFGSGAGVGLPGGVAASPAIPDEVSDPLGMDEAEHQLLEAKRLERLERNLIAKLERLGSLSPAEEAHLREIRLQLSALQR